MAAVTYKWVSETTLLARIAEPDLERASRAALALYLHLRELELTGVIELVPAAGSVLIFLRPEIVPGHPTLDVIVDLKSIDPRPPQRHPIRHEIPVRYGGENGPDLTEIARLSGLEEKKKIIRLHCEASHTVVFLGFAPGFPYLVGLPERLHMDRLATPRPRLAAGSVAIAGPFSGIYPGPSAGGWRILGRTEHPLFDPARHPPATLAPGDEVRFISV